MKDDQNNTKTIYGGEIKQIRNPRYEVLFHIKPTPVVQGKLSIKWGADGQLTEINGESDTKAPELVKAVTDAIPNLAKLFGAGAGIASEGPVMFPLIYKLQEDGAWEHVSPSHGTSQHELRN